MVILYNFYLIKNGTVYISILYIMERSPTAHHTHKRRHKNSRNNHSTILTI